MASTLRRYVRRSAAPLAVLLLFLTSCSNDDGADQATTDEESTIPDSEFTDETGKTEVEMSVIDNTFTVDQLMISSGTTVTFTNDGRNDHNIISVDDSFESIDQEDFAQGDVVTITFDTPGEFAYYCSLHGTPTNGQNGVIRVTG